MVSNIQLEGEELMLPSSLMPTGLHAMYNNLLLVPLP
jgi:hypothetical protein